MWPFGRREITLPYERLTSPESSMQTRSRRTVAPETPSRSVSVCTLTSGASVSILRINRTRRSRSLDFILHLSRLESSVRLGRWRWVIKRNAPHATSALFSPAGTWRKICQPSTTPPFERQQASVTGVQVCDGCCHWPHPERQLLNISCAGLYLHGICLRLEGRSVIFRTFFLSRALRAL